MKGGVVGFGAERREKRMFERPETSLVRKKNEQNETEF